MDRPEKPLRRHGSLAQGTRWAGGTA